MINRNKKGFTIVELVIVIAVIAILAAVLIPTFAGVIKKANLSADQQAVRQMNTALAVYEAENGKPETLAEAKKALDEALVNVEGGLVPVTQGYAFYWDKENNEVVLVGEDDTVTEGWVLLSNNGFGKKVEVKDATELSNAIANATKDKPVIIKLTDNVDLGDSYLRINEGIAVTIDLNGKTINSASTKNYGLRVDNGGSLTIEDGTIHHDGQYSAVANVKGTLLIDDVDITTNKGIYIDGISDTVIKNSKVNVTASHAIGTNSTQVESDGVRISLINSEISSTATDYAGVNITVNANVTIEDCVITGDRHAIALVGNTAVVKNTKLVASDETFADQYDDYYESGNNAPSAAAFVAAPGGTGYASIGSYTFENVTFEGAKKVTLAAGADCTLTVTGVDAADVARVVPCGSTANALGNVIVNGTKVDAK